ncbi:alpha/beta fold hydrolase [Streptosporangium sp. NBC_01756]|uniref:alpha/beta fold hydrolase n=1 Tax=Streptosporangium sp. NBC_01756 TaxID=2975950 RepID=UPI002DDC0E27|nr:alpha/beta hydrolase [Streptosporangium sp. NBC_01756]WSC82892.1 alpha/beta hydrolase [Streptosporangium sp. NBC_01756]
MKSHLLPVSGADLYYQVRGTGPLLLLLQGGDGDADRTTDLVDQLIGDYTVVTYDRRGLSRSLLTDPARPVSMDTHADDVHHLLNTLTDEPAHLFGSSFGGLVALTLTARHPEQVATLVAHEPGAIGLLSDDQRIPLAQNLDQLADTYHQQGALAAMTEMGALVGIDLTTLETEPDLTVQQQTPEQRAANIRFLLTNDVPALRRSTLVATDITALKNTPARIVPAAGHTSPIPAFPYQCAAALAGLLGTDLTYFPGCHNGNTTHPRAFATRLREIL